MYRAIVIDDDQWAIADMKSCFAFEKYGFILDRTYTNAEDALRRILSDPPELIVSDICMEKQSGIDLARVCSEHDISSLIVLVSGHSDFQYVQEAFKWRVFQYLLKPLEDDKVEEVLRRAALEMENRKMGKIDDREKDPVDRAIALLEERYATVDLRLETVAEELFINKTYLSERFRQKTGMSFTEYKNLVRIRRAKELLRQSALSMTEIAQDVGLDSASYFTRLFKQVTGQTPQAYRNNHLPKK